MVSDPGASPGASLGHGAGLNGLCAYSGGFLDPKLRRVLGCAGLPVRFGWPDRGQGVAVWGRRPVAVRGRWVARRAGVPLVTIEDGFLRSVFAHKRRDVILSLIIDPVGIYFETARPNRLQQLLLNDALFDDALIERARAGMGRLRELGLSKFNDVPLGAVNNLPAPGYILVVDQVRGDASIAGAGADAETFRTMLAAAIAENPGRPILIKSHPVTGKNGKRGHFTPDCGRKGVIFWDRPVNPWDLLAGASALYTVSSQLGYEALLAGVKVHVFGRAFYAGWGLSEDRVSQGAYGVARTPEQLFAACHLCYPIYYDPWRGRCCSFEDAMEILHCLADAWRPDHARTAGSKGEIFVGVQPWKRPWFGQFRPPSCGPVRYCKDLSRALEQGGDRPVWVWASKAPPEALAHARAAGHDVGAIEDGFLRSVGLGAALHRPASLVFDRRGIYFDPDRASDLEGLIAMAAAREASGDFAAERSRALRLIETITTHDLSKYNVGGRPDRLTRRVADRRVVLVPGQVEDDASVRHGTRDICRNSTLLSAVRAENPDAWLIYKPHPDVEAGLRQGAIDATGIADEIAHDTGAGALLGIVDEVWTMTSLIGFEALLRGRKVHCLGLPFYAGWGLTTDRHAIARRRARPSLPALVWATLIAYPRYVDPISGLPATPEFIAERLSSQRQSPSDGGWMARAVRLWHEYGGRLL